MPGLEGLEAYLTTSRSVVMPISSLSAMYFVYVVIGQTIYRGLGSYITYDAVQTNDFKPLIHYLQQDPRKTAALALTFTATADYILIHRCHTIWGSRKWITLPLAVASIGTNVVGVVGASIFATGDRDTTIDKNVFLALLGNFLCGVFQIMSVIVNLLVTTLTAGRIWWMSRQSHGNERVYKSVLRIVIESGVIYPIFTLVQILT
ncbi:hypothetical protein MPER_03257, partial [Moniliophthora perniciosa FA553]